MKLYKIVIRKNEILGFVRAFLAECVWNFIKQYETSWNRFRN